jgi:hypothetical protein
MSEDIPSRPTPPAEFARLSSQNTSSHADRHNADVTATQQRQQAAGDRFSRNDEARVDLSPAGREALESGRVSTAATENENRDGFNSSRDETRRSYGYGLKRNNGKSELDGAREAAEKHLKEEIEEGQKEDNPVDNAARLSPAEIVGTQDAVARLDRNEDGRIDRSEQARVLRERETGGDARLRLYQQTAELVGGKDTDIVEDPEIRTDRDLYGFAEEKTDSETAQDKDFELPEREKIFAEEEAADDTSTSSTATPPNAGFAA